MKNLAIKLVIFYQKFLSFNGGVLSILTLPGGTCKYSPSCSEYTIQAINKFGALKGLVLGGKRILSCR